MLVQNSNRCICIT